MLLQLARAAVQFPSLGTLIETLLTASPKALPAVVESVLLLGPQGRILEPFLVAALTQQKMAAEEASRLLGMASQGLKRLRVAVHQAAVRELRRVAEANGSSANRVTLARWLHNLGVSLWEVGEAREALATDREAVALHRRLAADDPAGYTADLAHSLTNLAASLWVVGEAREAVGCHGEAVARWWHLTQLQPDRHDSQYEKARADLARFCAEHGYEPGEAVRAEIEARRAL